MAPGTDNASLCQTLADAPARFRAKVRIDESGCWLWTAAARRTRYKSVVYSYGTYSVDGTPSGQRLAHRVSYELFTGPIPQGLEVDHLCHNKLCVNPSHLVAVTHQENCKRRLKSGPYRTVGSVRDRRAKGIAI
jgi:hypothetical protein